MSFQVEDGTGLSDATSYLSVEKSDEIADTLLSDPQEWTGLSQYQKELYLMRATINIDSRNRWISSILEPEQALGFPRKEFKDREGRVITGIPRALEECVLMLAYHEAVNGETPFSNQPRIKSESYGKTSVEYSGPISEQDGEAYFFMKRLRSLGYASSSSIVDIYRA